MESLGETGDSPGERERERHLLLYCRYWLFNTRESGYYGTGRPRRVTAVSSLHCIARRRGYVRQGAFLPEFLSNEQIHIETGTENVHFKAVD